MPEGGGQMPKEYSKKDIERMKFAISGKYIGCYLCNDHPLYSKYGKRALEKMDTNNMHGLRSFTCGEPLCLKLFPKIEKEKTCPCNVYSDIYINWKVKSELHKTGLKYE